MTRAPSLGAQFDPWETHYRDPYSFYQQAREQEPVLFWPQIGGYVLTRHTDVLRALRDTSVFSSANALKPLTPLCPAAQKAFAAGYPPSPEPITSDGEAHRQLRTPLVQALSPNRVRAVEPFIHAAATALVDAFVTRGEVEIMGAYARPLPLQVIAHLFALDTAELDQVGVASYDSAQVLSAKRPDQEQTRAAENMVWLHQYCGDLARQRHAQPGEDVISHVTRALYPDPSRSLTGEQEGLLGRMLAGVLLAGHITTSSAIGNALRHLLTHRDQWELLCTHPNLFSAAVEEVLRFDPPVQTFFRVTTQPVTLAGGEQLPAGTEVLLAYGAANHDPALTADPDRLDILRERTAHLTFGTGPHHCVGHHLARAGIRISLEILTQRLSSLELADQVVEITPATISRGPRALRLVW